jgi:hypothetical protein
VLVSLFDVLFAEGDYVEPDIVIVRSGREHILTERGAEGPPDLLVQVLSPSTAARDLGIKLDRYRHFGVAEYCVVDPDERRLLVWRLADGASEPLVLGLADTLRWQPVAGGRVLEISIAELFQTEWGRDRTALSAYPQFPANPLSSSRKFSTRMSLAPPPPSPSSVALTKTKCSPSGAMS